jgi:hypothetical protein
VIDDSLYRRYIAALIAYERDLEDRIRSQMGVGLQSDTTSWRTMVPPGDPTSVILQTMDSEA